MRFGAHLPLIDWNGAGWSPGRLAEFTDAARELGYSAVSANDHLRYPLPWPDGIVALSSVVMQSGSMDLMTSIALPIIRGPVVLARAAVALHELSGGRLLLGVGAGSSARDYEAVGIPFEERWRRFDEALGVLEAEAQGVPIWVASWGSPAGLRRVARHGAGWLASAYNIDAPAVSTALAGLGDRFPCALATTWTFVTRDADEAESRLAFVAGMLGRPVDVLRDRLPIGSPEHCARVVRAYADAGVERVLVWPLADEVRQLEAMMLDVLPLMGPDGLEPTTSPV